MGSESINKEDKNGYWNNIKSVWYKIYKLVGRKQERIEMDNGNLFMYWSLKKFIYLFTHVFLYLSFIQP